MPRKKKTDWFEINKFAIVILILAVFLYKIISFDNISITGFQSYDSTTSTTSLTTTTTGVNTTTTSGTTTSGITTTSSMTENFRVISFSYNTTLKQIKLNYTNSYSENILIQFLILNKQQRVIYKARIYLPKGSATIQYTLDCKLLGVGNYILAWNAFKQSDQRLASIIDWSRTDERINLVC
jgi:hypothetical protein